MRRAELMIGTTSILIATDQSPPSHPMIHMIKKGVAHGKMGGDGMEGEASAGASERAPGDLTKGVDRGLIH